MVKTVQVWLPVTDILVVEAVDHVLTNYEVGLVYIRFTFEKVRRNQICLMNRRAFFSPANFLEHLIPKPHEIKPQLGQHGWRSKVSGKRFVTVQQVLGVFPGDNFDRIEQPLKIALFHKRSADIRHDEIAYEHCALTWDIDQHGVVRFSALDRNQIESRSADIHSRAAINLDIRLVVANIVKAEVAAKKLTGKYAGRIELPLDLFLIVASAIKAYLWIHRAKVLMATHMIPVSMGEENRGERRKPG